jgi:hypothetical protein
LDAGVGNEFAIEMVKRAHRRSNNNGILILDDLLLAWDDARGTEELAEAAAPVTGTIKEDGNDEEDELVSGAGSGTDVVGCGGALL